MYRVVYPMCEMCVHYIKFKSADSLSKCAKFTYFDYTKDAVFNEYADYARRSSSKCGQEGKLYERVKKFSKDDE